MMSRHTKRLLAAAAVVLAAALSDEREPVAPSDQPDLLTRPAAQGTVDNPNALAKGVAGFGGFFYDAAGTPTVYLKDSKERGNTERALAPYFQKHGVAAARMQVRPGKFSWDELERWQASVVHPDARAPGRGVRGRGRGEQPGDHRSRARKGRPGTGRAGAAGPAGIGGGRAGDRSHHLRGGAEAEAGATLQGVVRPIHGGTQINFPGFLCTLGFSANDGSQRSFITNSHCTNVQGGVNNTPYWQPTAEHWPRPRSPPKSKIQPTALTSLVVPAAASVAGPMPRARSTAARARRRARSPSARSRRQSRPGRNLTITGEFSITARTRQSRARRSTRSAGQPAGRRARSQACASIPAVSGTNITQLCQDFVTASVGSGDSGSPVFAISSGTNVTLLGILWGGSGRQLRVQPAVQHRRRAGRSDDVLIVSPAGDPGFARAAGYPLP